jgi:hypothetical protein
MYHIFKFEIGLLKRIFAWCAICFLCACTVKNSEITSRSFEVFSGFSFVGSGPYAGDSSSNTQSDIAKYGSTERLLPARPLPGIEYVFVHKRPVDNSQLALQEVPRRLHAAGINVVKGPTSARGLTYPFIGGPLFRIQIKVGTHEGVIFNTVDPDLLKGIDTNSPWGTETYKLVWLK